MKLKQKLQAETGCYHGIDPEDYFALTHANKGDTKYVIPSKSMLTKFEENPEKWKTSPPFVKTSAMTAGSLLDCLLLTPKNVTREFILKPQTAPRRPTAQQLAMPLEKRTPAAEKSITFWEDFDRQAEKREVITSDQMKDAKRAVKMINKHNECNRIINSSQLQTVCIAEHRGFLVKGMFDIVPDADSEHGDSIIDLKRTSAFTPQAFKGIIRSFKYHWQAALYRWLYEQTTGQRREKWKFMVSDSEAPFSCGLVTMHEDDIKRGEDEVFAALDHYIDCVIAGNFPNPYTISDKEIVLKSFSDIFND